MGLEAHFIRHKRIALAALMGAALLAFVLTRPGIAPAGPAVLLVNSTANTSDGQCNDANCTLREAIDAANTGPSNTIHFDPAIFPSGTPAVIDIEGGDGALPSITADITIDATGSGVIIDGDTTDDGTAVAQGLKIDGGHAGFGFTLHGGGHFTLRDIGARGIDVLGHSFPLDTLAVDGVSITNTSDDGITVSGVQSATHISVTNSTIDAGDAGIRVNVAGPNIQSMDYTVTNDDIRSSHVSTATGAAVALNMQAGLATGATINFTVNNNARLRSRRGVGINLAYCSSTTPCAMDHSQINVSLSGNTLIEGDGDAIHVRLNGAPAAPATSTDSSVTMHIDNNTAITAGSDDTDITSTLCCGANNQQTYTVDGNGPITNDPSSGKDGVDIEAESCCSPGSGTSVDVSSNHGTIAASGGEGIQLRLDCCGSNSINIQNNEGEITSATSNSIKILNCVKDETDPQAAEADCIGRQTTLLTIANNLIGGSLEDGIRICCGQFQRGDQRSVISNNTVVDNGRDGVLINSSHGINVGPGNVITRNGGAVSEPSDAVKIDIFASVLMFNRFGVVVPAGGNTITKNEIQVNGGLGIDLVGFNPAGNPSLPLPDDIEYRIVGCHAFPSADISANACRHSPSLIGVATDSLSGTACTPCRIEVFSANDHPADQADDVGGQHGEGAAFLAAGDTTGGGTFSIPLPCNLGAGLLTATATDSDGNTSEFSLNMTFGGTSSSGTCLPPTPTPTGTIHPPTSTPTPRPPTATPTPTRTATPSATATPTIVPVLCGDVNGDHAVNSIDAALVLQYTAGLLQTFVQPMGADVNHDGAINSIDAALILQATAGLPATLTCS